MQKQKFIENFDVSIDCLIDFTSLHCTNKLANNYLFWIQPSGTDAHNGLNEYEIKNLKKLNKYSDQRVAREEAINLLWHDNKVPLWIDTTVYESRPDVTIVHLLCSRRLRSETELNHRVDKYPPFHIQVSFPFGYDSGNETKKFDIN